MLWFRLTTLALLMSISFSPVRSDSQVTIEAMPVIDVDGGCLLGGSEDGKWLKMAELAPRMSGGDKYRIYGLNGEWKSMTGDKPSSQGPPCEDTMFVEIPKEIRDSMPAGSQFIGVAGKWNPMPRPVVLESTRSPIYRNAVIEQLRKKGIRRPRVNIIKIVRVDLDGDGVTEVIVNATNVNRWESGSITPNAKAGDYSFVMLRKVVNGKVITIMLDQEYHTKYTQFSAPNEYSLSAVLDLNGDGVMEIVVAGAYYEGNWKTVYSMQGIKAVDVLGCGCGA
jgi:hypothetical protein